MNISKKKIFFLIYGLTLPLFFWLYNNTLASTEQAMINFIIKWAGIRHGTPSNLNLWTPITSSTDQEITGQFTDKFWVEDLQWDITWYYTTIQCDGVYGSAGNKLTWIYLKAGNITPTYISWITGNVHIGAWLTDYANILTPVTYIYKPTDPINAWIWNTYWDTPRLKILIPGWTPPGTYSGTIVFSFYMY